MGKDDRPAKAAAEHPNPRPPYHGARADLKPGDLIDRGENPGGIPIVEPTGPIIDDPNLTDKKWRVLNAI